MLLKRPSAYVCRNVRNHRKTLILKRLAASVIVLVSIASFAPAAFAAKEAADLDLGFQSAFPRKPHQSKYFAPAITGASMVAGGAFTYFTAGAGAPAAATGVGAVASWVGGGGAGSYMAGLSTIGGWFGGNAMLGSAILNGVSLGTVGGMGNWGALSAAEKALALSGTAATAMDGIAILSKPGTSQLEFRFMLPVPLGLADERARKLLESMNKASHNVEKLSAVVDDESAKQVPGSQPSHSLQKAKQKLAGEKGIFNEAKEQIAAEITHVLKHGSSNRTAVVMAVVANNEGRTKDFRTLLKRIQANSLTHRSYLDYLRAIAALQTGNIAEGERLLYASLSAASYAIEPPILLAGVLGRRGRTGLESKIDEIASYADKHFDANAYMPGASLVSLHFRIGDLELRANRCERALHEFKRAQSEFSLIDKYWKGKDVRNLLDIGVANTLFCMNRKDEAYALFKEVWNRPEDRDARYLLCDQFRGGCERK